jgi:hypothetical protein
MGAPRHLPEPDDASGARQRGAYGASSSASASQCGRDSHWAPGGLPQLPPSARALFGDSAMAHCDYSSRLLTMRDGTRVAVDVCLPAGGTVPRNVVFIQCRYGRAWRLRWPYNKLWGGRPVDFVYFLFRVRGPDVRVRVRLRRF